MFGRKLNKYFKFPPLEVVGRGPRTKRIKIFLMGVDVDP